jgi:5'-methylthioadenosine phosphorylase
LTPICTAIVGGSGLYDLAGLEPEGERTVTTPFGPPSDRIRIGRLGDRPVAFLARHGPQHTILPGEINYRANIYALKTLGVERIFSASAVGSLRESIRPRDVVLVDQFVDLARRRAATFFGEGLVAHVSLADPICPELRALLLRASRANGRTHDGGAYLCIEGPAFSTRAESELYRSWGLEVIGMTNATEAKLAREAEICYATLALVTDYDCWHEEEEDVSVAALLDNLRANGERAAEILRRAIAETPVERAGCACGEALRHALITPLEAVPAETARRLAPLVGRYLGSEG